MEAVEFSIDGLSANILPVTLGENIKESVPFYSISAEPLIREH